MKILYINALTVSKYYLAGLSVAIDRGTKKDSLGQFCSPVKVPVDVFLRIPQDELDRNKLSWYDIEAAPPILDIKRDFLSWLKKQKAQRGWALVGDLNRFYALAGMLEPGLAEAGFPSANLYDIRDYYSILVSRRVMPYLPDRKLDLISEHLGVLPAQDLADSAWALRRIYQAMLERGLFDDYP